MRVFLGVRMIQPPNFPITHHHPYDPPLPHVHAPIRKLAGPQSKPWRHPPWWYHPMVVVRETHVEKRWAQSTRTKNQSIDRTK